MSRLKPIIILLHRACIGLTGKHDEDSVHAIRLLVEAIDKLEAIRKEKGE